MTVAPAGPASDGAAITWPLARGDRSAVVDLPDSTQLLNQTSSRFGPDGRLYLTWYACDSQGRHQVMLGTVAADGRLLSREAVSDNSVSFDLLGRGTLTLPLSRPQLVVSKPPCARGLPPGRCAGGGQPRRGHRHRAMCLAGATCGHRRRR